MEFLTTKFMRYSTVFLTEHLLPLLVMFVIMFPSLSQLQMMEMTNTPHPIILLFFKKKKKKEALK